MTVRETPLPGPVPCFEVPDWRARYGVLAGITARGDGPGGDFDLGLWSSAPVGQVMGRWRAFRGAFPGFRATILAQQVHGARVEWHDSAAGWQIFEGIDGHATARPGLLLTVTVADCIPVYLVAPTHRAIALLHAGWRGTGGGILGQGLALLESARGIAPSEIVMHCGVGICGNCYEVGSEVMSGCGMTAAGPGPWHLDLRDCLARQAAVHGVGHVSTSQWCSGHDRAHFYSHRASGGRDGRMVAYLGLID